MKEVQEKLLPGELGVSPISFLLIPHERGIKGVEGERHEVVFSDMNGGAFDLTSFGSLT